MPSFGQPAAKFLAEFASDERGGRLELAGVRGREPVMGSGRERVAADPVEEAYQRGHADGVAEQRSRGEAQLAELAADFDLRLEAERQAYAHALADGLANAIRDGLSTIHASLSLAAAQALAPLLSSALGQFAIIELAEELAGMIGRDDALVIELAGPQPLIDRLMVALAERCPDVADRIDARISAAAELRVSMRDDIIETRFQDWVARVSEAGGS